jgi:hypothetical protein
VLDRSNRYFREFTFLELGCIGFRSMRQTPPSGIMLIVSTR